jgi:hypothetical protein
MLIAAENRARDINGMKPIKFTRCSVARPDASRKRGSRPLCVGARAGPVQCGSTNAKTDLTSQKQQQLQTIIRLWIVSVAGCFAHVAERHGRAGWLFGAKGAEDSNLSALVSNSLARRRNSSLAKRSEQSRADARQRAARESELALFPVLLAPMPKYHIHREARRQRPPCSGSRALYLGRRSFC